MNQFPSPMVEMTRSHGRIEKKDIPGKSFLIHNVLLKPVEVYYPNHFDPGKSVDLLLHFHGLSRVPKYAVNQSKRNLILAIVNLGSGSSVYEKPFLSESVFPELIKVILDSVSERESIDSKATQVYLSSFSAGYGAVRALLRHHKALLDGIMLLDGLHTDYIPSGRVLAQDGQLNIEKLSGFLEYARLAIENKKRILITHSEIFPGTYASTTETADYLIKTLNLKRKPVLKWGPVGMQMLSETRFKGLSILGFAGNTAPDHVDHYHGLPWFLTYVMSSEN